MGDGVCPCCRQPISCTEKLRTEVEYYKRLLKTVEVKIGDRSERRVVDEDIVIAPLYNMGDVWFYVVADLREFMVVKARKDGCRFTYGRVLFYGVPTAVIIYGTPGKPEFRVKWETPPLPPLWMGPASAEKLATMLRANALAICGVSLARRALSNLLKAYVLAGRAERPVKVM